jgi:hypothetical protein
MEVLIYVVKSGITEDFSYMTFEEKKALEILENCKKQILEDFNGLTIIPNCLGLWKNPESEKVESDKVELWQILTTVEDDTHEAWIQNRVYGIALKIKETTRQQTQLYAIDREPHLI